MDYKIAKIRPETIRISIGLEDPDNLIADLKNHYNNMIFYLNEDRCKSNE